MGQESGDGPCVAKWSADWEPGGRNSEIWAEAKRDGETAWHRSRGCPTTVPVPMGTLLRGNLGSWAIPIALTIIHQTCLDLPLLQLLVEFYSYINYLKSEKKREYAGLTPYSTFVENEDHSS